MERKTPLLVQTRGERRDSLSRLSVRPRGTAHKGNRFRPAGHARMERPAKESNLRWTILWHTREDCAANAWNIAHAETEAGAYDRAKHFLKLGFPVYAIRSATGSVSMDRAELLQRFGPNATSSAPSAEIPPRAAAADGTGTPPAAAPSSPLSAHTSGGRL